MTTPNRALAIVLAVVASAGFIVAAFTQSWLVDHAATTHFGLREQTTCEDSSTCTTHTNQELEDRLREEAAPDSNTSHAFAPTGWASFVLCLLAAFGLLVAAGLAAARARPELPLAPTTVSLVAIMLGLIAGCVFVATKPLPNGMLGVGLSFYVFGGGCVIGIAASQLLAKVNRPPDPDLMEDAMNPDQF